MFVCVECGSASQSAGACAACGGGVAPVGDDYLLGQMIGPYRVARLLGVGGMGRVYKGVHPQIGSRVAIKVLSRECADRRDLVDRFFAEARAVNVANHENIVNVVDLAMLADGRPYIVMEYLDGAPLSSVIEHARQRGAQLPLGGIARVAAEVLDALAAAHAKGIVHRDLKPDNIFVLPSGRVKVLDFGVAKLQPELGGSATHTGSLLGTPYYMSPEQASSRPVDARTDIYAMGVIVFECATLNKPFVAAALYDLLKMHVEQPPPSPRAMRPDMPADLEQVILAALAKPPDQRFSSARAMSTALQHATRGLPPEQWTTIVPGAPAAGGWQQPPPSSWANTPRVQPQTVSAGQVTAPVPAPTRASRKTAWLAITALTLVGGGIAAGVVAARSHDDRDQTASAGSAGAPAPPAAPGQATTAPPATPTPTPGPPLPTSGSAADHATPPTPVPNVADDGVDLTQQLDTALSALSPDDRAALPPKLRTLLAKYGSYSKIPKAERTQIAAAMLGQLSGTGLSVGQQVNTALAAELPGTALATQIAAPPKPHSDALVDRHDVSLPHFDPKSIDTDALVQFAVAHAKAAVPDAQLTRIDIENVNASGHADVTIPVGIRHASLAIRFRSPSHATRDPSLPRGANVPVSCEFRLVVEQDGSELYPTSTCSEIPLGVPKCSVAEVWKKVLAKHPDSAHSIASIDYMPVGLAHHPGWSFTISENGTNLVSETFADDCR